jgi:hypothetical protein
MKSLPTQSELQEIRKSLKPKKIPKCYSDTKGAWENIGSFAFSEGEHGLQVTWHAFGNKEKTELFKKLCLDESQSESRLELGWLIASIYKAYINDMLLKIPDPAMAQHYTKHESKMFREWKHWALVAAGNMIIPEGL